VVDPVSHHGFASSKPITMFHAATMATIESIAVDGNPDGLSLDAGRVYVLSHSAPNITAINAADGTVLGTVNLDADGAGATVTFVDAGRATLTYQRQRADGSYVDVHNLSGRRRAQPVSVAVTVAR